MLIVASYSIKGGVGKTSAAVNLAYLSARHGRRTLLWDLDPQAATTYLLRVRPEVQGGARRLFGGRWAVDGLLKGTDFDGLDLLPADFSYRSMDLALDAARKPRRRLERMLSPLADDYDVVILDCPPSVSLLSENVLRAADLVLSPIIPSTLSVRTYDQLLAFIEDSGQGPGRVAGFLSMVDRRRTLHRRMVDELPAARPGILPIVVPSSSLIERMGDERSPVAAWAPRSAPARAYTELWGEVTRQGTVSAMSDGGET
jgi:cellulose biosynthesis protein BcsQ